MSHDPPIPADAGTPPPVARADRQDGHLERDDAQLVRVVHQVKPQTVPAHGPALRGPTDDAATLDVRVSPDTVSVWEAGPADDAP